MGKPCSMDLRVRIVACVNAGTSARAAGRRDGVSASTAVRLAAAGRAGSAAPKPQGRTAGPSASARRTGRFPPGSWRRSPTLRWGELAAALEETQGVVVPLSTGRRALRRAGLT